jgi:hypothetical protein
MLASTPVVIASLQAASLDVAGRGDARQGFLAIASSERF